MIITFITISKDVHELSRTRKSIINTMQINKKNNFNMIFVLPENKEIKKMLELNNIPETKSEYICFDKNQGIYQAMNIGINKAMKIATTHISFINGGDLLERGFLKSLDLANQGPDIIVGGYTDLMNSEYKKIGKIYKGGKLKWNIIHPGSIYPAKVFENRRYNSNLKISADWHLNYELRSFYDFRKNREIVSSFNLAGISQSENNIQLLLLDEIIILKSNIFNYFNPKNIFYLIRFIALILHYLRNSVQRKFSRFKVNYNIKK